jgi:hypothetical protein
MQIQKGAIQSLVQKALLTSGAGNGAAGPLVPQHLEKLITNTIVRLAPEIALITPKYDAQTYHEFNRLTALPAAAGQMGEGAVTPTLRSTYVRTGRILKVIRRKGAVTNFLQDASKNYVDASAIEMENHVQAHVYDLVTLLMWGNDNADALTFPGLDLLIQSNRTVNVIGGIVPTDLAFLDDMIDKNLLRQGAAHRKAFIMSPQMLSKISRMLTNVRLNQGLSAGGMSVIDVPGGWRLQGYRDIPIIQSTQMRPTAQMTTVTPTTSTIGGTIAAGTYYFMVSVVDWGGEELASAEVSQVTTGSTSVVTLAWATWTAGPGGAPFYYKIYASKLSAAGSLGEKLVCVLPGQLYDVNGTPADKVISVQFSTDPSVANPTISLINATAPAGTASGGGVVPSLTATVPTVLQSDVPLYQPAGQASPPERIILWDLDEIQGLGKVAYTNAAGSRFNGLVSLEPLAKTDDNLPFLIKSYLTMIDSWEATSVVNIGLRVS